MNSLPAFSMDYSPRTPRPMTSSSSSFALPDPSEQKSNAVFQQNLSLLSSQNTQIPPSLLSRTEPTVLIDKPDFFLIDLPSGKPDPAAPCTSATLQWDDRPRIAQADSKDNTCWYYAFKTIRKSIGKNPTAELAADRSAEKFISDLRKEHSKLRTNLPELYLNYGDTDDILIEGTKSWCKESVEEMIDEWDEYQELYEPDPPTGTSLLDEFHAFLAQEKFEFFYDFMVSRVETPLTELIKNFIAKTGYSPQDYFSTAKLIDPENTLHHCKSLDWEKIEPQIQNELLHTYSVFIVASTYRLGISFWSPFHPIDSLIHELKDKGPHVVGGHFTFPLEDEIKNKETLFGRPISFFDDKARGSGHMITIIGAKKNDPDGDLVYYVDPNDGSDPTCPRKIYSISYSSLQAKIFNHLSTLNGDLTSSFAGYAWVGPR